MRTGVIGAVQGIPVCFDAKECNADTFPLQNIHEHQIIFMENLEKQQGISFLLIYYTARNEMYYMRFEEVAKFWNLSRPLIPEFQIQINHIQIWHKTA